MEFEPVPRLPIHHVRGATLHEGPRLWVAAAFGGDVSLHCTVGGVSSGHLMHPAVALAVARELIACVGALGEQQQE